MGDGKTGEKGRRRRRASEKSDAGLYLLLALADFLVNVLQIALALLLGLVQHLTSEGHARR